MNAYLLDPDGPFDPKIKVGPDVTETMRDLDVERLVAAMAGDDRLIAEVSRAVMWRATSTPRTISLYRQHILIDGLRQPAVLRRLFDLAGAAMDAERRLFWSHREQTPAEGLRRAVQVHSAVLPYLRDLRAQIDILAADARSQGLIQLTARIQAHIDDAFLRGIETWLQRLSFKKGIIASAGLGSTFRGEGFALREWPKDRRPWIFRFLPRSFSPHCFVLHPRDEGGFQALELMRSRILVQAASAVMESMSQIMTLFSTLRTELAFYVGCLNLRDALVLRNCRVAMPTICEPAEATFDTRGLYDVGLALRIGDKVVPNDVASGTKPMIVVTGANQGGKSTLLRALGLAYVMMHAGLFVGADSLVASPVSALITHFRREEDASMTSGKLDEELRRLDGLVSSFKPGALVLFNESFASTNEREGSAIATQVTRALVDAGLRVVAVTHLFSYADGLHREHESQAYFLRAERGANGERPYRFCEGAPLATSYARDLYDRVFADDPTPVCDARFEEGMTHA